MVIDRRSYGGLKAVNRRVVIESIDTEGGIKATSLGGEEIFQPADLDRAQHYGFKSNAPQETEGVMTSDAAGSLVIAERDPTYTPSDFNDVEGETILYSKDGCYVYLENDAVKIKNPDHNTSIVLDNSGNVSIENTSAGDKIELDNEGNVSIIASGRAGETSVNIKGSGNIELNQGGSGDIYLGNTCSDFAAMASEVDNAITSLRDKINSHVHVGVTTGSSTSGQVDSPLAVIGSVASNVVRVQ